MTCSCNIPHSRCSTRSTISLARRPCLKASHAEHATYWVSLMLLLSYSLGTCTSWAFLTPSPSAHTC